MSENFSIFSKVHDYWLSCGQSKLSPIIRPWDVSFKMSLFAQYFGYSSHVTRLPLSDVIVITVNRYCIEIALSWQHVATTSSGPGCNLEKKCSCFRLHHNHHSCFLEQAMSASYNTFLMMSSPCAEGFMFGTLKHRYLVFICYHRIVGREIDHWLLTMIAASQRQQWCYTRPPCWWHVGKSVHDSMNTGKFEDDSTITNLARVLG